jgi:hypothetical protein
MKRGKRRGAPTRFERRGTLLAFDRMGCAEDVIDAFTRAWDRPMFSVALGGKYDKIDVCVCLRYIIAIEPRPWTWMTDIVELWAGHIAPVQSRSDYIHPSRAMRFPYRMAMAGRRRCAHHAKYFPTEHPTPASARIWLAIPARARDARWMLPS